MEVDLVVEIGLVTETLEGIQERERHKARAFRIEPTTATMRAMKTIVDLMKATVVNNVIPAAGRMAMTPTTVMNNQENATTMEELMDSHRLAMMRLCKTRNSLGLALRVEVKMIYLRRNRAGFLDRAWKLFEGSLLREWQQNVTRVGQSSQPTSRSENG